MLTHWIIGAGQIGSYLAACLQHRGEHVAAVARGQWFERLQTDFTVTDYQANQISYSPVEVVASLDEANIGASDWVWLTTKSSALAELSPWLDDRLSPTNTLLCCQNGVGAKAIVAHRLQAKSPTLLSVMVPFNVVWHDDRLHRGSEGILTIEQPDSPQLAVQLAGLNQGMLPIALSRDINAVQWAKLQLNLGNAVNALANMPVKAMLENRGYRKVIAAAMDELLAVCAAKSMVLPKVAKLHGRFLPSVLRLPNWLFTRVASQMLHIDPTVKTSMWCDYHGGKATEIDFLQGAVVQTAKTENIATPVNQWLLDEISRTQGTQVNKVSMSGEEMLRKIWQSTVL